MKQTHKKARTLIQKLFNYPTIYLNELSGGSSSSNFILRGENLNLFSLHFKSEKKVVWATYGVAKISQDKKFMDSIILVYFFITRVSFSIMPFLSLYDDQV